MTVVYCIDTSSMIDAGERYYPIDVFPGFWDKLDTLIESGRLKAPKTLLEGKDEKWREWVYARADKMIWPIDAAIQAALHQVMPIYAANVTNVNSIKGDPFFVAASLAFKATLITSEKARRGGAKIPKICDEVGVDWITLLDASRAEGWKFGAI